LKNNGKKIFEKITVKKYLKLNYMKNSENAGEKFENG